MTNSFNPLAWNWNQIKANGRHWLSYGAGVLTVLVAWGMVSQTDSTAIMTSLNEIFDGAEKVVKGIAGIVAVLIPIYTSWKAAKSAAPENQIKAITELPPHEVATVANSVEQQEQREKLISAVAEMPEVKKVVALPSVARNTPSDKVVVQ